MNELFIWLIKLYKKNHNHNFKNCKYYPTCSTYGLECFEKFSFFKAFFLTSYRILRCNPFSKGGYDPTPQSFVEKTYQKIISIGQSTL